MERENRPKGREKHITEGNGNVHKRGSGLHQGAPVGSLGGRGTDDKEEGGFTSPGAGRTLRISGKRSIGKLVLLLIAAAVESALEAWFSGERLGKSVLRAELGQVIWAVPGVANYAMTAPVSDVAVAASELPVAGTLAVTEMS